MEGSKIILSEAEAGLIANAGIILTKNQAIEKIVELFALLGAKYQSSAQKLMAAKSADFDLHPKISKGEKHEGLPWVMLDYPRTFSNTNGHLAVRCFFWWGRHFSIQLQLSGNYLNNAREKIKVFDRSGWYCGFTTDPWKMDIPAANWLPVNDESLQNLEQRWFKMAKKIPIDRWESVIDLFPEWFEDILPIIASASGS